MVVPTMGQRDVLSLTVTVLAVMTVWVPAAVVRGDGHTVDVVTPVGTIRGAKETHQGDTYYRFSGIPYAKPPVGPLRLAKPQPYPSFGDEVFNATSTQEINCPYAPGALSQLTTNSEDCLLLNIVTKSVPQEGDDKKVMIYIHGGAFVTGSAYLYKFLNFAIRHDVIVVSVNYRLGVLGFLSTEDSASPGNYGLWDQHMAIKWVHANIDTFGGNPDDITISGESAGAMSVGYQTITPHSEGLFTKVHMHSGGATSRFAMSETAQEDAVNLAKNAGCWNGSMDRRLTPAESIQMIECLRGLPLETIPANPFSLSRASFVPRVDNDFISDKPLNLLHNKTYLEDIGYFDRDYFLCFNNGESLSFHAALEEIKQGMFSLEGYTTAQKEQIWAGYAAETLQFYKQQRLHGNWVTNENISKALGDFYDRRNALLTDVLTELLTDLNFNMMAFDHARAAKLGSSSRAFMLFFDYYPQYMEGEGSIGRGTAHGGDMLYWMGFRPGEAYSMEVVPEIPAGGVWTNEDTALDTTFSDMMNEFVKNGDPQPPVKDAVGSRNWEYDVDTSKYLVFNSKPWVSKQFKRDNQRMWLKQVPEMMQEFPGAA